MDIIVDPRFRDKIPKPSEEERRRLEENILADGYVREPLVLWKGKNILVDGHNRWDIIQRHSEIPYETVEQEFGNEWDVIAWICRNQLGRRNISKVVYDKLIQEEHDAIQMANGGDRRSAVFAGNKSVGENPQLKSQEARAVVAHEHGITENAVRSAVEFGRGLDAAEAAVPGFKDEVLSGETKAKKGEISEMRNMEPELIAKKVEEIRNPKPKVSFPSARGKHSHAKTEAEREIEEMASRKTDKTAVIKYGIEDLLEELRMIQEDFIEKYYRVLDLHMDIADRNTRRVNALMKKFDQDWNEVKEKVQ